LISPTFLCAIGQRRPRPGTGVPRPPISGAGGGAPAAPPRLTCGASVQKVRLNKMAKIQKVTKTPVVENSNGRPEDGPEINLGQFIQRTRLNPSPILDIFSLLLLRFFSGNRSNRREPGPNEFRVPHDPNGGPGRDGMIKGKVRPAVGREKCAHPITPRPKAPGVKEIQKPPKAMYRFAPTAPSRQTISQGRAPILPAKGPNSFCRKNVWPAPPGGAGGLDQSRSSSGRPWAYCGPS